MYIKVSIECYDMEQAIIKWTLTTQLLLIEPVKSLAMWLSRDGGMSMYRNNVKR